MRGLFMEQIMFFKNLHPYRLSTEWPITAAMLGYTRRGTGWVKKNAASTTQEAMNHGS